MPPKVVAVGLGKSAPAIFLKIGVPPAAEGDAKNSFAAAEAMDTVKVPAVVIGLPATVNPVGIESAADVTVPEPPEGVP